MPIIVFLDFWEQDKLHKKINQYDSFDEMPTESKEGIVEIAGKKYKILSKKKTSASDFTNHHKTADSEIYEVFVEQI